MSKNIIWYFLFLYAFEVSAFAMGSRAPFLQSPLESMTESTASVNQMTETTNAEGEQEEQWNQEEEDLEYTDEEKEEIEKQQEEIKARDLNDIEDYRYDVPIKNKILD